jgi:hypothetical protein
MIEESVKIKKRTVAKENVPVYKERLMKCIHEKCTVMQLFQLG